MAVKRRLKPVDRKMAPDTFGIKRSSYIDPAKIAQSKGQLFNIFHIPSQKDISFFAYLTSLNEVYRSNWSREPVYGRMDPIHVFANTSRLLTVKLQVVAADFKEARANYRIVTKHFPQMLYPTYKKHQKNYRVISSPPLFAIQHVQLLSSVGKALGGNYSNYLIGSLDGLNINPDFNFGAYEGVLAGTGGPTEYIYPKIINVGFTLHVLHDYELGWNVASDEPETPAPDTGGGGGAGGGGDGGTGGGSGGSGDGDFSTMPVPTPPPGSDVPGSSGGSGDGQAGDGNEETEDGGTDNGIDPGEEDSVKPNPGAGDVLVPGDGSGGGNSGGGSGGGDDDFEEGEIISIDPDTGEVIGTEPVYDIEPF